MIEQIDTKELDGSGLLCNENRLKNRQTGLVSGDPYMKLVASLGRATNPA